MDSGKDGAHHRAGDRNFGQLEGDGAGVAHDTGADLDQLQLEGCQRPMVCPAIRARSCAVVALYQSHRRIRAESVKTAQNAPRYAPRA